MIAIADHLRSLNDLESARRFVTKLKAADIPLTGGRYFTHIDFKGQYLRMNEIVEKMSVLVKDKGSDPFIFNAIYNLNRASYKKLSNSCYLKQFFTYLKQLIGNWGGTLQARNEICRAGEGFKSDKHSFECYRSGYIPPQSNNPPVQRTKFFVVNMDTLEALKESKSKELKPVILDIANAFKPGGYRTGGTQEYWLVARSKETPYPLAKTLEFAHSVRIRDRIGDEFIPDDGCLYLPKTNYYLSVDTNFEPNTNSELIEVATICCAAPDFRGLERVDVQGKIVKKSALLAYQARLNDKIRSILYAAKVNGHASLILGAMGCGVFQNPPKEVAKCFKTAFETEFKGVFHIVVFAILGPDNRVRKVFSETFYPMNKTGIGLEPDTTFYEEEFCTEYKCKT